MRYVTQDDAHIFCAEGQIDAELDGSMGYLRYLYGLFGIEPRAELSTRPDNKLGSDEEWDFTEGKLIAALERHEIEYFVGEGEGSFYGPKIDLHANDSLGRSWQLGTIQLDAQMPARFGLTYMGADNREHPVFVVHRALYGSFERFIGLLLEHYAGALPVWLAPVQVRVVPVAESHHAAADELVAAPRRATCGWRSTRAPRRSRSGSATPSCRRCRTSSSGATARPVRRWPSAAAGERGSRRALSRGARRGDRRAVAAAQLKDRLRISACEQGWACYVPCLQSRSGIAPHLAGYGPREVQPSRFRRGNAAAACSGVSTKKEDRLGLVNCL